MSPVSHINARGSLLFGRVSMLARSVGLGGAQENPGQRVHHQAKQPQAGGFLDANFLGKWDPDVAHADEDTAVPDMDVL
jgi:hypothetical protein